MARTMITSPVCAFVIPSISLLENTVLKRKRLCVFLETAKTEKLGRVSYAIAELRERKLEK